MGARCEASSIDLEKSGAQDPARLSSRLNLFGNQTANADRECVEAISRVRNSASPYQPSFNKRASISATGQKRKYVTTFQFCSP